MWKFIFGNYLRLTGWKIKGGVDPVLPKYVGILGPHTANMDFVIAVMVRSAIDIPEAKYLGKSQLFKWPFGWFFRKLGGFPVERTKNMNWVQSAIEIFNSHDRFAIGIAPEGTRSKVDRLKTGFYHIAKGASVPIIMVGLDFSTKTIHFEEPFYPSDDIKADFKMIIDYFSQFKGKNPDLGIDSELYDQMEPHLE